ncbi:hypothetical protein [Sphingomonas crocodyli]|uniref:Uncharacterized protein n=1 Tax=Sphingomonas crocodyli TaxID=1979270 RepID=A0A437M7H7_9SPHN|nr:hypothetical protein [Sphingomonas crocodyli]RVT93681.1 hypothetical protein EOD43_07385 [Sphingomonas crocodyli]
MIITTEADKEWTVELASHKRGWWAAGYIYRGKLGTHQGQFVPVHHCPTVEGARAYAQAMLGGLSRFEARDVAQTA